MPTTAMNQASEAGRTRGDFGRAWPVRLRLLTAVALVLAIVVPAVAALEGWEIDAARLIGSLGGG